MADTCEFEGCPDPAEGCVEGQWTVVDFVRYDLCHNHLWEAYDKLQERTVDGLAAAWIAVSYYEDPVVWLTR